MFIKEVIVAIDSKDIGEIRKLIRNINKINKNDIILELYNNNFLTVERFQFIMKECTKYLNISSNLVKRLIKDRNVNLLDIIFSHFKFYDKDFILQLLFYYKYRKAISASDLKQQISNKKFKISIDAQDIFYTINKYLINEFDKKNKNISLIKYLIELEGYINEDNLLDETVLFDACRNGSKEIVKYLVERGTDINKINYRGETPLFFACLNGNEAVVKYLIEQGIDINKENDRDETPLFYACYNGNEAVVKCLVEQGADVNKKNDRGETPLFYAYYDGNEEIIKYLVEQGADINKKNKYGKTPLSFA